MERSIAGVRPQKSRQARQQLKRSRLRVPRSGTFELTAHTPSIPTMPPKIVKGVLDEEDDHKNVSPYPNDGVTLSWVRADLRLVHMTFRRICPKKEGLPKWSYSETSSLALIPLFKSEPITIQSSCCNIRSLCYILMTLLDCWIPGFFHCPGFQQGALFATFLPISALLLALGFGAHTLFITSRITQGTTSLTCFPFAAIAFLLSPFRIAKALQSALPLLDLFHRLLLSYPCSRVSYVIAFASIATESQYTTAKHSSQP